MFVSKHLFDSAIRSFNKSITKLKKVCELNTAEMQKNNDRVYELNNKNVELQQMTDKAERIKGKLEELLV